MDFRNEMVISQGIESSPYLVVIPSGCINDDTPLSDIIEPFSLNTMSGFTNKDIFCMISSFDNAACIQSSTCFLAVKNPSPIAIMLAVPDTINPNADISMVISILLGGYIGIMIGLIFLILFMHFDSR